ncbi:DUF2285 domain-containing protein [uncultured Roseobacter sp.]|uniref:DNA -binding domain-containing protein n=1 Tax=uncultured Roseobacter sp. TaxID=114847 RepID=UPI0026228729|nr:DUF2285 domain-containing protein [uncultured Roseobacter sp.]
MTKKDYLEFFDAPPSSDTITDYDRSHLPLYARLLDAEADGATLAEIAHILFGIDADDEPERARCIHESHLDRAHWMTRHGYRSLLVQS